MKVTDEMVNAFALAYSQKPRGSTFTYGIMVGLEAALAHTAEKGEAEPASEDWVLVPREAPTEMWMAWDDAYRNAPQGYGTALAWESAYAAMLEAAPPAPRDDLVAEVENNGWNPINTCPYRTIVDLWCVYGGEEFAQYESGASIGHLVSSRRRTKEYGFFGNQSNDGVPRKEGPDLKPVAWRPAVPMCPPEIIAAAMNVPVTYAEAVALSEGRTDA